jgi:hypothetical protein
VGLEEVTAEMIFELVVAAVVDHQRFEFLGPDLLLTSSGSTRLSNDDVMKPARIECPEKAASSRPAATIGLRDPRDGSVGLGADPAVSIDFAEDGPDRAAIGRKAGNLASIVKESCL